MGRQNPTEQIQLLIAVINGFHANDTTVGKYRLDSL